MLNIYDPNYLRRIDQLNLRRKQVLSYLEKIEKIECHEIRRLRQSLIGPMRDHDVDPERLKKNLIRLIKGKGTVISRIEAFAKDLNLPPLWALEILFWIQPSLYPPFTQEMAALLGTKDVVEYVKAGRILIRKYAMENFIELQAALMKEDYDLSELVSKLNSITIYEYDQVKDYIPVVRALDSFTKEELLSKLHVHEYIIASLVRKPERPMILDGSNIFMLRKRASDIEFILERVAEDDHFFYPFVIVFDRNIAYRSRGEVQFWINTKHAILHSPADEMIVKLALEWNAVIVSSDRFSEWGANLLRIDPRRFFK